VLIRNPMVTTKHPRSWLANPVDIHNVNSKFWMRLRSIVDETVLHDLSAFSIGTESDKCRLTVSPVPTVPLPERTRNANSLLACADRSWIACTTE
jgi:hypothetical protein